MTKRQTLEDLELFELLAATGLKVLVLHENGLSTVAQHGYLTPPPPLEPVLHCGFEDCGVAYIPVARDNVGGMHWTCPGCARLTKEAEKHLPNPDD
jgi:hypothetical protein